MILNPVLYRRRLIPNECILLKDDVILSCTDNMILTKWNALRPKKELHHGFSAYFLKEHIKVSKFCKEDNTFMCRCGCLPGWTSEGVRFGRAGAGKTRRAAYPGTAGARTPCHRRFVR